MKKLAMVLSLLFLSFVTTYAQCSDAGVCSIGGHALEEEANPFEISLGYSYGYSGKEDDISYSSIKLRGTYKFYDNAKLHFEIPFNMQSGPMYDVHGIGDLIFNLTYGFEFEDSYLSVSAGMRLSTASENKEPVIQQYKSGLGTNDVLLGIEYTFSNLLIGAGYQIAGKPEDNLFSVERGDDLLLRTGYNFEIDDFSIIPQLLFIKRLSKSKMYIFDNRPDVNSILIYSEVDGSDQSQLNLLVSAAYHVNENYSHFIEAAIPFLKRDVNVDGLKRAFTISTGLRFSF